MRSVLALAICLGVSAIVAADTPDTSGEAPGGKPKMKNKAQNVVPITDFMAPPEFPFAPKPKPPMWKRLWHAMLHPFDRDEKEELPPGVVAQPGVLPTVGLKPAPMPKK